MKRLIPIPALPLRQLSARSQIKAILEANFKNNPAKLREAAARLIEALPPCDPKLQLLLIVKGEVEPNVDALTDGLIEGWRCAMET